MASKAITKKKPVAKSLALSKAKRIAAGEFKAKCLGLIDEINVTGQEIVITKRGKPAAKLVAFQGDKAKKKDIFGRLEGIIEIVGDPDDLIKPVFPLEDYDMLK